MTSNMMRALVKLYHIGYIDGSNNCNGNVDFQTSVIYNAIRAHDIPIPWDKLKHIVNEYHNQ